MLSVPGTSPSDCKEWGRVSAITHKGNNPHSPLCACFFGLLCFAGSSDSRRTSSMLIGACLRCPPLRCLLSPSTLSASIRSSTPSHRTERASTTSLRFECMHGLSLPAVTDAAGDGALGSKEDGAGQDQVSDPDASGSICSLISCEWSNRGQTSVVKVKQPALQRTWPRCAPQTSNLGLQDLGLPVMAREGPSRAGDNEQGWNV